MSKKDESIVFIHALGKTTLNPDVKNWTYEQLEKQYKGVLDYDLLAKQLGIKPKGLNQIAKPESEKEK